MAAPWYNETGLYGQNPQKQATKRTSAVQTMGGLQTTPNPYGWNFGVGFMQNSAPAGVDPAVYKAAKEAYLQEDKRTTLYNNAYKSGYTGTNHLGSLLSADGSKFNIPDYEWQSANKRAFEQATFDWGKDGKGYTTKTVMDYARGAPVNKGEMQEFLYKAYQNGVTDRGVESDMRRLEKEQWDLDDETAAKQQALMEQYQALMAQQMQQQQEQARYQQSLNVASQARQRRMADKYAQRFEGDKATGGSGAGGEAASQKLLSVKPRGNAPKLGSREKLGARSLLGG